MHLPSPRPLSMFDNIVEQRGMLRGVPLPGRDGKGTLPLPGGGGERTAEEELPRTKGGSRAKTLWRWRRMGGCLKNQTPRWGRLGWAGGGRRRPGGEYGRHGGGLTVRDVWCFMCVVCCVVRWCAWPHRLLSEFVVFVRCLFEIIKDTSHQNLTFFENST